MIHAFADAIDIGRSRVVNHPRYLFLCGGQVSDVTSSWPPLSLRQHLHRAIESQAPAIAPQLILAEDIFSRFEKDHYGDLLSFERDLAFFCSVIVIVLESPGAIAELGSFVLLEGVIDRLYAIIDESHYKTRSFIRLGPVEYLKARENERVLSHDWLTANGRRPALPKLRIFQEDLVDDIISMHSLDQGSRSIDITNRTHQMIIVAGVIRVAQPLILSEILEFLRRFNPNIAHRDLEQFLSLLQALKIIERYRYGNQDYYLSDQYNDMIGWAYKANANNKDITRWIADFNQSYNSNERRRINVIKGARRSR